MRQASRGRRARRTGVAALSLLLASAAVALVLAGRFHVGVAGTVVALLAGLPGFYLMWAAYRDDRLAEVVPEVGNASLPAVADRLAVALRTQWADEAAIRRLDDPLLPVR